MENLYTFPSKCNYHSWVVGTELFHQLAKKNLESTDNNFRVAAIADKFNWETPLFVGRVINAQCNAPKLMRRTEKVQILAELATRYCVVNEYEHRSVSLRSLEFLLPQGLPILKSKAKFIPDLQVPWWILLLTVLNSPKI